jgi:hypothetical protein
VVSLDSPMYRFIACVLGQRKEAGAYVFRSFAFRFGLSQTISISLEGTLGSSSLFPSPRALEACTLIPSVFIFIAYHSKMLNEAVGRIGSSWLLSSLFCSLATPALVMLIHVPAFDLPSLPAAGRGDELQDSFVSDIQRYASSMDWEGALAAGRAGSWMGVDSLWKKVVGE